VLQHPGPELVGLDGRTLQDGTGAALSRRCPDADFSAFGKAAMIAPNSKSGGTPWTP
jgi:hypothetical protein